MLLGISRSSPLLLSEANWEHADFGGFTPEASEVLEETLQSNRPGFAKQFICDMVATPPPAEVIDEMYAESMNTQTSVATALLRYLVDSDFRDVVPEMSIPTLLVYGEQSKVFPSDVGSWMHGQITDSELVLFSESGHAPFWEGPDMFNEAVGSFVERITDRDVEIRGAK